MLSHVGFELFPIFLTEQIFICRGFCLCLEIINTRRFTSIALRFVLLFFSPLSIAINSFAVERAGLCAFRAFVCLCCAYLLVSLSSFS